MSLNNTANISTEILLDTLLPGFGLLSRLCSFYFHVDTSKYAFYILLIVMLWAFATFALPGLLSRLENCLLRHAASVEIMFQDALYGQTMDWVSKHSSLSQTKRSIAGTRTNYISPWFNKEKEGGEENDEEGYPHLREDGQSHGNQSKQHFWQHLRYLNKRKPIRFTPRKDEYHLFRYQGCIFAICRQSVGKNKQDSFYAFMENVTIYAAPWNRKILWALIEDIQKASLEKKSNHVDVYRGMKLGDYQWVPVASSVHRSMDSVIMDPHQKEKFQADVEEFLLPSTSRWYAEHNLNYRRGYLFHGRPGTGKSSLSLAMATFFSLDIYVFSLRSLDENGLALLLQGLPARCVLLLEDIDTAGLTQRHDDMNAYPAEISGDRTLSPSSDRTPVRNGPITLGSLLNELDGVSTKAGRILIMTTNRKDQLDSALLRPGRVDMEVEFTLASSLVVRNQFLNFYAPEPLSDDNADHQLGKKNRLLAKDEIDILSTEFASHIPGGKFTQAEIQNHLLNHRNDPLSAVANACEWSNLKSGAGS
ncbi:hypothetical protein N7540_010970 [Penicillium herquei]|nr:hypothetical protein N7540_010970 [Penicillium herquei]